mmetsp:Transcript_20212/g.56018  ORF Transcript_20212/g.56018 Transcript_20212/m.56018 type:complete len:365 (+) Transcript_20212:51-1145(+)
MQKGEPAKEGEEAKDKKHDQMEADSGEATIAQTVGSKLWKDDVFVSGHTAVWGSWYDSVAKRWGYACCHGMQRDQECAAAIKVPQNEEEQTVPSEPRTTSSLKAKQSDLPAVASFDVATLSNATFANFDTVAVPGNGSSAEEDSETSEETLRERAEDTPLDWNNPPAELLPSSQVGQPAAYVEHFVRFFLGIWQREFENGFNGIGPTEQAMFTDSLPDTKKAITPLIWRLRKGETLERGEKKSVLTKSKSRETRTSMEGKYVKEKSVLDSLFKMASFSFERDYAKAHETYMQLTFGNKMWNSTHVAHVAACTMKGAREYRRNRDTLNTYDMDPVSQKYMHAMKKIVNFAQCMRPSSDQSKNVVL